MLAVTAILTILSIAVITSHYCPLGRKLSLSEVTFLRPPGDTATLDSKPTVIWCQNPSSFHLCHARSPISVSALDKWGN